MKKEIEKMKSGDLYCFTDQEVIQSLKHARQLCAKMQVMTVEDKDYRETIEKLIPNFPKTATICPPFHCDHGHNISIGDGTFINYNSTMLDTTMIKIGSHCQIGPNCQLYTPIHPIDYMERRMPIESSKPINIGNDCWLGGGVIVLPGITIGDRSIIGAGSVVTKDIPEDCIAAGNPCRVIKKIKTEK